MHNYSDSPVKTHGCDLPDDVVLPLLKTHIPNQALVPNKLFRVKVSTQGITSDWRTISSYFAFNLSLVQAGNGAILRQANYHRQLRLHLTNSGCNWSRKDSDTAAWMSRCHLMSLLALKRPSKQGEAPRGAPRKYPQLAIIIDLLKTSSAPITPSPRAKPSTYNALRPSPSTYTASDKADSDSDDVIEVPIKKTKVEVIAIDDIPAAPTDIDDDSDGELASIENKMFMPQTTIVESYTTITSFISPPVNPSGLVLSAATLRELAKGGTRRAPMPCDYLNFGKNNNADTKNGVPEYQFAPLAPLPDVDAPLLDIADADAPLLDFAPLLVPIDRIRCRTKTRPSVCLGARPKASATPKKKPKKKPVPAPADDAEAYYQLWNIMDLVYKKKKLIFEVRKSISKLILTSILTFSFHS